jgi:hypothetical protein
MILPVAEKIELVFFLKFLTFLINSRLLLQTLIKLKHALI